MHSDLTQWNRQTYSLLDWLGDLGGLTEALVFMMQAILWTFSGLSLQVALA